MNGASSDGLDKGVLTVPGRFSPTLASHALPLSTNDDEQQQEQEQLSPGSNASAVSPTASKQAVFAHLVAMLGEDERATWQALAGGSDSFPTQ
jgi:hypothetical protein